jgi:protoporphyrinogen oxidase
MGLRLQHQLSWSKAAVNDIGEITGPRPVAQDWGVPKIAILGAGPAGIGAALRLARDGLADVEVIEARDRVGGNASGFMLEGVHCDLGSHRLHPKLEPRVMSDIEAALGPDLLWRPRHGRIRLQGRWIHFPLKPADLVRHLPFAFVVSLALDLALKALPRKRPAEETFASVLERGLGSTMCQSFYFPYARKLWGLAPEALAVTAARRRIANSSIPKILLKVARQIPGLKSAKAGGFYYPRRGYGQISEGLRMAGEAYGVRFVLGARVSRIDHNGHRVRAIHYQKDGGTIEKPIDAAWSTLPISLLVRLMNPQAPPEVLAAAKAIRFRGMVLIYLVLEQDQFSEFDAHYFPEESIPVSRLSEPKNYSASLDPRGLTVLCAELPSDPEEESWSLSDRELGRLLCQWLADVDLPVKAPIRSVVTRRLGHAYPVYDRGYATHFDAMEKWLSGFEDLLTFGRQGLFAHDNTHHALTMAYAAADCLKSDGSFDRALWSRRRRDFENHVVED